MIWKVIGKSVVGASHTQSNKPCEDAVKFTVINPGTANELLTGFISDGAGSAEYAAEAAQLAVQQGIKIAERLINERIVIDERHLLKLAKSIYKSLADLAEEKEVPINEFSCTLMGFIMMKERCCFLQIGDGAIIINDGDGNFVPLWWPQNGEYQNTTSFLIDDAGLRNLKIRVIEERVEEIAVFTDGLQMLALNNESETVHQPFFNDLFKWLRMASDAEHVKILNNKLADYLGSEVINNRTDDDKTLLLATRIKHGHPHI